MEELVRVAANATHAGTRFPLWAKKSPQELKKIKILYSVELLLPQKFRYRLLIVASLNALSSA